jgi:hypothetical protein
LEPRNQKLFALTSALVKEGLAFIERLLLAKRSIKTYEDWPVITWSEGMPDFTFYTDEPPIDYTDAFNPIWSLFRSRSDTEHPFDFEKQQEFQELEKWIRSERWHVFPPAFPEMLFSSAIKRFLESAIDRYIHVAGKTSFDSDKFIEVYLPLEAALLLEDLPIEIQTPILLANMPSDLYELDDNISLERMSEPIQLARARRDHSTHNVNEYILQQASHALVLRNLVLPNTEYRQRFWGYSVSADTLDIIDTLFACLRIITSIETGYAQILFVPLGWAFHYEATLPALEGMTTRKYPPTLEPVNLASGGKFPNLSDHQVQGVCALFRDLNALKRTQQGERLRLVIKRLNSCYMREDQEDAILDATIGLEILLSDGDTQEVTHKLALRLAALSTLVPGFEQQAPIIFRNVKKAIYPYRSAVVHGDQKKARRTSAFRTETGEVGAVRLAIEYLGMAVRAVAAHPTFLAPAAIDNDLLLGQKLDGTNSGPPIQGQTS